jgi:hypothetical protein
MTPAETDHAAGLPGRWLRQWVIPAGVVVSSLWGASPAQAKHAYRCDTTADPRVDRIMCLPHQAWDAVSGGHPAGVLCPLQERLGVDHVKDCHASP